MIDNIENIGINSAKYFKNFFGELIKDDLEIEIEWEDYNFNTKSWFGSKEKLLQFYNTFDSINTLEPVSYTHLDVYKRQFFSSF